MSVPATAGSATLTTTDTVLFDVPTITKALRAAAHDASSQCPNAAAITIVNRDAANDVWVRVPAIHVDLAYAIIAPGASQSFGLGGHNYSAISKVYAKAPVGAPIVNWSITGVR